MIVRAQFSEVFRSPRREQERRPSQTIVTRTFSYGYPRQLFSQTIAGLEPVAIDEFLRGHAALAFDLNFDHIERSALTTSNQQMRPILSGVHGDGPGH